MANFVKKYALTVAIIWLCFTAILMYEHTTYATPKWIEYANYALITWLTLYVLACHNIYYASAVLGVFAFYAFGAHK